MEELNLSLFDNPFTSYLKIQRINALCLSLIQQSAFQHSLAPREYGVFAEIQNIIYLCILRN